MKKLWILLALAVGVIALASLQAGGQNSASANDANTREARMCVALLNKMSNSPAAHTWQNRMLSWKCRNSTLAKHTVAAMDARGTGT